MTIVIKSLHYYESDILEPMIQALANFHNSLNHQFSTFYPIQEVNKTIEQIKKGIEKKTTIVLGAYQEQKLLGFIELVFFEQTAKINRLFVEPQFRNHRIGTQLMNQALTLIQTKAINHVDLTVVKENLQAKKFYERFSFEERTICMTKKFK